MTWSKKLLLKLTGVRRVAIKQPMNRVSQGVAVEGDEVVVAVVDGMIVVAKMPPEPKGKATLMTTKNCLVTDETLVGSGTKGTTRLLRLLKPMGLKRVNRKMFLVTGWMLVLNKEILKTVQVLGLTGVKMMIKSSREQVIDHHAAAAAAVVVAGHEMVKWWVMMVSDLVRKKAKNRM